MLLVGSAGGVPRGRRCCKRAHWRCIDLRGVLIASKSASDCWQSQCAPLARTVQLHLCALSMCPPDSCNSVRAPRACATVLRSQPATRLEMRACSCRADAAPPMAAAADAATAAAGSGPSRVPQSDSELAAWLTAQLTPSSAWLQARPRLDPTFAHEYLPEAGFDVAVDGALRLGRPLPAAAMASVSPPGAFYQDHPVRDDVKARSTALFFFSVLSLLAERVARVPPWKPL